MIENRKKIYHEPLSDKRFIRNLTALVISILLCVIALGGTTYALFFHSIEIQSTVSSVEYGLIFTLDSEEPTTVMMTANHNSLEKTFADAGTHSLHISPLNANSVGFCIITVVDTENGTRVFHTEQIGNGGESEINLTLSVLSSGLVYIEPHWGTSSNYGYLTEDTIVNNGTIEIGLSPVKYNTFTHSDNFSNVEYLYRVGNRNSVSLGSLFKVSEIGDNYVDASNVKITVAAVENTSSVSGIGSNLEDGSNGRCNYIVNLDNWTESMLKFEGEGPVEVTIREGNGDIYTLNLEVVDAFNATSATSASDNNIVLLNNIGFSTISVEKNHTLYGNGFTLTCNSDLSCNAMNSDCGYVSLSNGTLDNVRIIVPNYEHAFFYQAQANSYKVNNRFTQVRNAVYSVSGNNLIYNSYISGGRSSVFSAEGSLIIENSTLYGGAVANLFIYGPADVSLNNVTTVQEEAVVTADSTKKIMGFGVYVTNQNAKITLNETLNQHNWVSKSQLNTYASSYSSYFNSYYNNNTFSQTLNNEQYLNFCFLFATNWDSENTVDNCSANLTDNRLEKNYYSGKDIALYDGSTTVNGGIYATNNTLSLTEEMLSAPAFQSNQFLTIPSFEFDYTTKNFIPYSEGSDDFCYYDDSSECVLISMRQSVAGDSFAWDPMILTVCKYGNPLNYTVEINGIDYTNKTISFSESGDFTVTYKYTDPYNYDFQFATTPQNYTKSLQLKVIIIEPEAIVYHPEFSYVSSWASTAKIMVINESNYVMPDVSTTSSSIGSTTVEGQTVYYPIVTVEGKNSSGDAYQNGKIYCFAPAFSAINIKDLDVNTGETLYTYNSETQKWPHNISAKTGPGSSEYYGPGSTRDPYGAATGAAYEKYAYNAKNGGLCYTSNEIERNITSNTKLVKFHYVGNDGISYYYYIKYNYSAVTYSNGGGGCLSPDTPITLADGSQKRVADLTGEEELLVWNLETGTYDYSPIVFIDSDSEQNIEIMHVCFSNGTDVEVVYEHGFFDLTLGKYVYINESTINKYIGHTFVTLGNISSNTWNTAVLTNIWIENRVTKVYSPVTFSHLCYYTNGVLSMPGGIDGLFNIFEVDTSTMAYNPIKKQRDIEKYGLLTMNDYGDMITPYMFKAFNGQYLAIAVGKGNLTWETIAYLAERYAPLCD